MFGSGILCGDSSFINLVVFKEKPDWSFANGDHVAVIAWAPVLQGIGKFYLAIGRIGTLSQSQEELFAHVRGCVRTAILSASEPHD